MLKGYLFLPVPDTNRDFQTLSLSVCSEHFRKMRANVHFPDQYSGMLLSITLRSSFGNVDPAGEGILWGSTSIE